MENWQVYYLAGIWDADGTFGISKRVQRSRWESFQPFAGITLCDPKAEIIGKLIEKNFDFKCVFSTRRDNPKWNVQYRWLLSSQRACDFAKVIEPYLIIKKERAQILMDWPKIDKRTPFEYRGKIHDEQRLFYDRMKKLNRRGL